MLRVAFWVGVLSASTGLCPDAWSQVAPYDDTNPARIISPSRGFQPGHSYALSDIESIDAAYGSVSLHIPLAQLPAGPAGFSAGLTLAYSSKHWELEPVVDAGSTSYGLKKATAGGWRLGMAPELEFEYLNQRPASDPCSPATSSNDLFQLRILEPDGSRHTMLMTKPTAPYLPTCEAGVSRVSDLLAAQSASTWYSIDGSYLRLVIDQAPTGTLGNIDAAWPATSATWTLYMRDGSSVRHDPFTADAAETTRLRDRMGNEITIAGTTAANGHVITTMADAYGRSIKLDHDVDGATDVVTQSMHNDSDADLPDLKWTIQYASRSPGGMSYWTSNGSSSRTQAALSTPLAMVTSLQLPNGLSYAFDYSSRYGELHSVTLPTGATATYGYRLDSDTTQERYYYDLMLNTVATKTLSHDGTSETWMYANGSGGGSSSSATMTAPDGGSTTTEFVGIDYRYGVQPDAGSITKITNPDLSVVQKTYAENRPYEAPVSAQNVNPWVQRETTSTANAAGTLVATSLRVFKSDKNGNRTSEEEHGWVPYSATPPDGPILRTTVTKYVNGAGDFSSTASDVNAYSNASAVAGPRTLAWSSEVQVGATVVSRSTFDYQESTPVSRMVGNLVREYHWDSTKSASIGTGDSLSGSNAIGRSYTYTTKGNLASETDTGGHLTTYTYGAIGNCPAGAASDLYRTGATRGGSGSVQQNSTYAFNCYSGLMNAVTDPNGLASTITHDTYGRPQTITEGTLRKTIHSYDDVGLKISTTSDVSGFNDQLAASVLFYDQLGRIKQQTQSDGTRDVVIDTRYVLGTGHNETWVSNPYWSTNDDSPRGWTVTRRDPMGRVCVTESFDGASDPTVDSGCALSATSAGGTTRGFDASANWTSEVIRDASGAARTLYQDVLGRLLAVVEDPDTNKYATYYTYDALDNLLNVRQAGTCLTDPATDACPGGMERQFTYTSLKRLATATNPESGLIEYQYDDAGNLKRRKQGSVVTCFGTRNANDTCQADGYDDLNRIQKRTYNDGTPEVDYTYDAAITTAKPTGCAADDGKIGRLASVGNSISTDYYFYNKLGYPQCSRQQTGSAAFDFLYQTTPQGEWTQIKYPSTRTVNVTLNRLGQPSAVGSYASGVTYWAHGGMKSLPLGNTVVENTGFNSRLQQSTVEATVGSVSQWKLENFYCGTEVSSCGSNNGNVVWQRLSVPKTAGGTLVLATKYDYDKLNRLQTATEKSGSLTGTPTWSQNYGYVDAANHYGQYGNLRVTGDEVIPTGMTCASYDAATNRCADTGYGYDGAGNTVSYPGSRTATYDAENRQTSLTDVGTWQYGYDGEGRRVKKTSTGQTVTYVYDARGQLAAESGSTPDTTCTTCYVTADHLGSTRLVTDGSGTVKRRIDMLPFGYDIGSSWGQRSTVAGYQSPDTFNPKFTGKVRDYESGLGLDYFGARYLSSAQGRFTSPDPMMASAHASDPQSWNRYAYARNNPLKYVDPDGLEVPADCANDNKCTIVVKVNVIYDKALTPDQRKKFEQGQIAKAKKDYATSNIQLKVSYTEGGYTTGPNGTQISGAKSDALNIIVSTKTPSGEAGDSGVDRKTDLAVTDINIDAAHNGAFWPFWTNTTSHELAHQFLGDSYRTFDPFVYTFYREPLVDAKVGEQSLGTSQPRFREGLEPRRYAAPLNPEANKPRQ
jgi:RHS repeat-associated protein